MSASPQQRKYKLTDQVDFLIVGCGASGSVLARELSRNGFSVVALEQGPWLDRKQFTHDEYRVQAQNLLTNNPQKQPTTFRKTPNDTAKKRQAVVYGRIVGGGTVHFTANYWRFHEIDFIEASKKAPSQARVSPTGPSLTPISNRITPRLSGNWVSPDRPASAPSIRRAPSLIRFRRCL